MHPGGMPETHVTRLWHPSVMRFFHKPISGGAARQASLNHRLTSGKPPACFSATPSFKIVRNVNKVELTPRNKAAHAYLPLAEKRKPGEAVSHPDEAAIKSTNQTINGHKNPARQADVDQLTKTAA
jgi:hypothetical protein